MMKLIPGMRIINFRFGPHWVKRSRNFSNFYLNDVDRTQNTIRNVATNKMPQIKAITSISSKDDWKKLILYNEVMHEDENYESFVTRSNKRLLVEKLSQSGELPNARPIFLDYMADDGDTRQKEEYLDSDPAIHFPYEHLKSVIADENIHNEDLENNEINDCHEVSLGYDTKLRNIKEKELDLKNIKDWLHSESETELPVNDFRFGTYDRNIPISKIPCGGCGALLHCRDTALPGFIPKEIFETLNDVALRGISCQRCLFLTEFNIALGISVNPEEYQKILSQIKLKKALVILMVDLLDFPCSIWPQFTDLIGRNKPIFVVGNKLDLIIQDKYEKSFQYKTDCLKNAVLNAGFPENMIQHVCVISAKTGFGVEDLINNLQLKWWNKGDIYLVGSTNAGKSTLFNSLIQSDFCKSNATDVLQRATISEWPGTTLNLLKFPVLKATSWRILARRERLKLMKYKEKSRCLKIPNEGNLSRQYSLIGYMGKTFGRNTSSELLGLDPSDPQFAKSKWCYDTPGVINEAQILNIFTTEELSKVLPKSTIIPRNFKLYAGNSLFIGGIARVDLIKSFSFVWFTVFASKELPVTVTNIKDADFIYDKCLGTKIFAVPSGEKKRLEKWPKLKSQDINVTGMYKNQAAADIVLSSAGWIAITLEVARSCELRAWTPEGRGIFAREPPLIKFSSLFRGSKIRGTPSYRPGIKIVESEM